MSNLTWPAWFNGPNGETEIFTKPEDVPAGWTSGAEKITVDGKPATSKPEQKIAPLADKVDAHGHAFDPTKHTGTMTKAGLWRMKVGVARPAPLTSLQHDL